MAATSDAAAGASASAASANVLIRSRTWLGLRPQPRNSDGCTYAGQSCFTYGSAGVCAAYANYDGSYAGLYCSHVFLR